MSRYVCGTVLQGRITVLPKKNIHSICVYMIMMVMMMMMVLVKKFCLMLRSNI